MNLNLELILTVASVITGFIVLYNSVLRRKEMFRTEKHRQSWIVEYSKSFFPVLIVVLALRTLVVEPFRIPSGSMYPTLQIGDFILVQKFAYNLKVPVLYKLNLVEIGKPKRGDVIVFRYPQNVSIDYVKRVVGLPGDRVRVGDGKIFINGKEVARTPTDRFVGEKSGDKFTGYHTFKESLADSDTHDILEDPQLPDVSHAYKFKNVSVPAKHYFVMGDNRDNSNDSRFWGFVPEENIKGKAFYVWLNWDDGIRFDRFGHVIK